MIYFLKRENAAIFQLILYLNMYFKKIKKNDWELKARILASIKKLTSLFSRFTQSRLVQHVQAIFSNFLPRTVLSFFIIFAIRVTFFRQSARKLRLNFSRVKLMDTLAASFPIKLVFYYNFNSIL